MGEVQFTENALSGICVFQLSRVVAELAARRGGMLELGVAELSLDLLPEFTQKEVEQQVLARRSVFSHLPAAELLTGLVNKRVGQEAVKYALGQKLPSLAGDISEGMCMKIAQTLKDFRFPCLGVLSWQNAQITAGGIPLREVDPDTMQSKVCPGLYLAGEILNLDGPCGGYNLHWAWASAMAIRMFPPKKEAYRGTAQKAERTAKAEKNADRKE